MTTAIRAPAAEHGVGEVRVECKVDPSAKAYLKQVLFVQTNKPANRYDVRVGILEALRTPALFNSHLGNLLVRVKTQDSPIVPSRLSKTR